MRSSGYDMSMGTGIYSAAPQWARIGVIMVVCCWHDALYQIPLIRTRGPIGAVRWT